MSIPERWRRTRPLPADILTRVEALPALFAAGNVRLAYLFGSLAWGEEGQDVDLALLTDGEPAFPWRESIGEILGTERVDLVDLGSASPVWRFEVIRTGRLLYAVDEEAVNAFESAVLREYRDPAWLRRRQREVLKRRMQAFGGLPKHPGPRVPADRPSIGLSEFPEGPGGSAAMGGSNPEMGGKGCIGSLRSLIQVHPEYKIKVAMARCRQGEIPLAQAAQLAGVSSEQMREPLPAHGTEPELGPADLEEAGEEVEELRRHLDGHRGE